MVVVRGVGAPAPGVRVRGVRAPRRVRVRVRVPGRAEALPRLLGMSHHPLLKEVEAAVEVEVVVAGAVLGMTPALAMEIVPMGAVEGIGQETAGGRLLLEAALPAQLLVLMLGITLNAVGIVIYVHLLILIIVAHQKAHLVRTPEDPQRLDQE